MYILFMRNQQTDLYKDHRLYQKHHQMSRGIFRNCLYRRDEDNVE